jgi:hypothetical protein
MAGVALGSAVGGVERIAADDATDGEAVADGDELPDGAAVVVELWHAATRAMVITSATDERR